jgi:hypothetical protein
MIKYFKSYMKSKDEDNDQDLVQKNSVKLNS